MMTQTKVEWLVLVGGGHNGPRPFDSEADALTYYEAEMAIPSYMGAGHKRHGSVTKVTTISEVIRPAAPPKPPMAPPPPPPARKSVSCANPWCGGGNLCVYCKPKPAPAPEPCGGCGEEDPTKACIGCLHFHGSGR